VNATDYFEDILFANLVNPTSPGENRPLVIAIDELSQLFAYPNIASEFLSLLRFWSEQAKAGDGDRNPWYYLRVVTVYSTEIQIPISIDRSLMNTWLTIDLPEFTPAQVQDLAERWGEETTVQQVEQLMALLGGHPYRLQLAFYYLQQQTISLRQLLENSEIAIAIYAEHLQQYWWNLQRYPNLWAIFVTTQAED
jgi:AAA-like domain